MNEPSKHSYNVGGDDRRAFLSAVEVGERLGVRRSRVYELAAAGMLPVVRLGRRMFFPRHGLDALAEQAIERAKAALPAETR